MFAISIKALAALITSDPVSSGVSMRKPENKISGSSGNKFFLVPEKEVI